MSGIFTPTYLKSTKRWSIFAEDEDSLFRPKGDKRLKGTLAKLPSTSEHAPTNQNKKDQDQIDIEISCQFSLRIVVKIAGDWLKRVKTGIAGFLCEAASALVNSVSAIIQKFVNRSKSKTIVSDLPKLDEPIKVKDEHDKPPPQKKASTDLTILHRQFHPPKIEAPVGDFARKENINYKLLYDHLMAYARHNRIPGIPQMENNLYVDQVLLVMNATKILKNFVFEMVNGSDVEDTISKFIEDYPQFTYLHELLQHAKFCWEKLVIDPNFDINIHQEYSRLAMR